MTRSRFLFSLFLVLTSLNAFADFHLESTPGRVPDATSPVPLRLTAVNATALEAKNVEISYSDFSQVVSPAASADWNCSTSGATVTCKLAHPLAAGASAALDLQFHFAGPARRELNFSALADIAGSSQRVFLITGAALYRRFVVTQTGDSGAGSLRAAVEALNADAACASVPCSIDFDITSTSAVQTIALLSPLPQINQPDVLVDGNSQTVAHGDTNPLGPEVALDGAATVRANGLDFARPDRVEVVGIAIGNFGDNAILVRNRHRTTPFESTARLFVSRSFIGVDATNTHAMPNFRGISLSPGWFLGGAIRDSVLSHNTRTAIFDWSEHDPGFPLVPVLTVEHNTISDNGASGIFLGDGSDGMLIRDNLIERNHDFGIAIAPGAINVRILANSIAHNGNAAIDLGLDGPGGAVPGRFGARVPAVIFSARYDPATNITTISGSPGVTPIGTCDFCATSVVSLWANDTAEHGQYAEAQTYLGDAVPLESNVFVLRVPGDLRGKYISALATLWTNLVGSSLFNAGELSKAVQVH